ncbi:uncharacterized protein LOC133291734 [Gastrolobium bilobum]|uniref:uncharacterized protein LOC133291734 n=1 Tax=Gastrolobium bilobum TaxID=150636 RepID=UPI002AB116C4|nr:uncharacterized protein LOC133291734 [Gastrolobium bilobum]
MQNPKHNSEDSNTDRKSPSSSSPQQPPPPSDDVDTVVNPTEEGSELNLKTPQQVLEELNAGSDILGDEVSQSGVPVAMEVGGSIMVMEGPVLSEGRGKKRKPSDVRDPPSGTPACPICHREFLTWKGAFGHMRKHPDRNYRGFFKPPHFESPSTTREPLNKGKN